MRIGSLCRRVGGQSRVTQVARIFVSRRLVNPGTKPAFNTKPMGKVCYQIRAKVLLTNNLFNFQRYFTWKISLNCSSYFETSPKEALSPLMGSHGQA